MYTTYTMYVTSSVWFDSMTDGRAHLRELLDAAERGIPAGLRRDQARFAVVDADMLQRLLSMYAPRPEVVAEAGGWSIFIPDTPVAADGSSLREAVEEMVDALREYAADWVDHLSTTVNHADNRWLVQLVELSTDDQLAQWLTAGQLAHQV